jgi:hypothetical protein
VDDDGMCRGTAAAGRCFTILLFVLGSGWQERLPPYENKMCGVTGVILFQTQLCFVLSHNHHTIGWSVSLYSVPEDEDEDEGGRDYLRTSHMP